MVNPNTVARAYQDLARDGLIEPRQGRGVFITRPRQVYTKAERTRRLDRALDSLISETLTLDFTHDQIRAALDRKFEKLAAAESKGGPLK